MIPLMNPGDSAHADNLLEGILAVLAKVERIKTSSGSLETGIPLPSSPPPGAFDPVPHEHVKTHSPEANPVFAPGIEFARLGVQVKFADLVPPQFSALPDLNMDTQIAFRNLNKKTTLVPGENIYSRTGNGKETYYSKSRGKVILIGNVFHLLPSDMNGRISVRVAPDSMSAWMDVRQAFGTGKSIGEEDVLQLIEKMRITHGLETETIRSMLATPAAHGRSLEGVLIATGTPAIPGVHGSMEIFFDKNHEGPANLEPDANGKIDYHQVKWIPMVAEGMLLARVRHSVPGVEGVNIFGRPVRTPAIPASDLIAGANVRAEKDNTEFYSVVNGCAQINGNVLDVLNMYIVNSDVDYRTGNIRFSGNVLITGSVQRGCAVEADGDIIVMKNAEPCRIRAGRDVHIKGGVLGDGKGNCKIEAGRNISVGYSENAWLEALGNIHIGDFAIQSFLYSGGNISLLKKHGAAIGGELMAANGVEAKCFGSAAGVKGLVIAGVNFVAIRKILKLEQDHNALKTALDKVDEFLKMLLPAVREGTLSESKSAQLKTIGEKRNQLVKAMQSLNAQLKKMEDLRIENQNAIISAIEVAYPEVHIKIGNRTKKIEQAMVRSLYRIDPKTNEVVSRPA